MNCFITTLFTGYLSISGIDALSCYYALSSTTLYGYTVDCKPWATTCYVRT